MRIQSLLVVIQAFIAITVNAQVNKEDLQLATKTIGYNGINYLTV